jgi:DNA-binding response OmpR family regulator
VGGDQLRLLGLDDAGPRLRTRERRLDVEHCLQPGAVGHLRGDRAARENRAEQLGRVQGGRGARSVELGRSGALMAAPIAARGHYRDRRGPYGLRTSATLRFRDASRRWQNRHMDADRHVRGSVLVVDDEPTIAEVVSRYLHRAGYDVRTAADGPGALERVSERRPDLVVLDLMLPGIDGLEVMRRLRDIDRDRIAIILLTAKGEESDRVVGLRLGADDYVVKPFSPAELVARVDAVLRRVDTTPDGEPPLVFDGLEVDPSGRRVVVDGEEVALTQREFELLLFLARHPGQAFTRHDLMDRVWRYSFYTDTSTVTVHVRRLRAKIERDPERPRYLETVWGVGYRFRP